MMATILNSAILDSVMLHKTLIQSNSIWLKLIYSDSYWWWQPSWILLSWIQPFCTKKTSLVHSDSTWWWQPSWILPCWIQTLPSWDSNTLLSSLSFTQKHSPSPLTLTQTNSIWLTRCGNHLGFSHFHKKTSLMHSHSTYWWQPSWILPSWIQPFCTKIWLKLVQSDSNSFILTQLDDISHLEFCHLGFSTLPSWIQTPCYLLSDSLKNHSSSTLTLTQTNSIWLKLIHSHLTWWWQSSWIWPSWIQPFFTKL